MTEECKVCGRWVIVEWARATVHGEREEAARLNNLMERGYCDTPECEAVALGNSGRET